VGARDGKPRLLSVLGLFVRRAVQPSGVEPDSKTFPGRSVLAESHGSAVLLVPNELQVPSFRLSADSGFECGATPIRKPLSGKGHWRIRSVGTFRLSDLRT